MVPNRVLLVEDNPDDEALTLRAIRKHRLANEVDVVRDGAEALDYMFCRGKYAERNDHDLPAVILLDLKLPKVDGLDVLKQLRNDARTATVPVVVLTSSDEEKDIVDSYRLGANSYVRKPVEFNEFIAAVAQLGLYWLMVNKSMPTGD